MLKFLAANSTKEILASRHTRLLQAQLVNKELNIRTIVGGYNLISPFPLCAFLHPSDSGCNGCRNVGTPATSQHHLQGCGLGLSFPFVF
jgi:hypothetical protein